MVNNICGVKPMTSIILHCHNVQAYDHVPLTAEMYNGFSIINAIRLKTKHTTLTEQFQNTIENSKNRQYSIPITHMIVNLSQLGKFTQYKVAGYGKINGPNFQNFTPKMFNTLGGHIVCLCMKTLSYGRIIHTTLGGVWQETIVFYYSDLLQQAYNTDFFQGSSFFQKPNFSFLPFNSIGESRVKTLYMMILNSE